MCFFCSCFLPTHLCSFICPRRAYSVSHIHVLYYVQHLHCHARPHTVTHTHTDHSAAHSCSSFSLALKNAHTSRFAAEASHTPTQLKHWSKWAAVLPETFGASCQWQPGFVVKASCFCFSVSITPPGSSRPPLPKSWRKHHELSLHFLCLLSITERRPTQLRVCPCLCACIWWPEGFLSVELHKGFPWPQNTDMGVFSLLHKTGRNKGRKPIWRMAELLLRKPVDEGIPPSFFWL